MAKQKIAEQEAAALKATKTPLNKARAPRESAKAVTHKHTKTTIAETPAMPTGVEVAAPVAEPSHEEIARLAYSYWEARGYQAGSPDEDWLRAVNELRSR